MVRSGSSHTPALFLLLLLAIHFESGELQLTEVCYSDLGCFSLLPPWTNPLRPFPAPLPPEEINVRLYCYTRESPTRYNITLRPDIDLNGCPLDVSKPLMFLAHGFATNGNTSWMADVKDNYLRRVDATVILVDWGQGAQRLNYLRVASNSRVAGAELARFLKFLEVQYGMNAGQCHLIGHSLGAHLMSYAAKAFPGIARITGLDPAQPGFEMQPRTVRLDKSDADFVEVVHTNGAPFIPALGFGMILPVGHVDFYMNGGMRQPGCLAVPDVPTIISISDLAKYPVEVVSTWVKCSHERAYMYYNESLIGNCTFWGRKADMTRWVISVSTLGIVDPVVSNVENCNEDNCIPLGLETIDYPARGSFVLTTNSEPSYCREDDFMDNKLLPIEKSPIDFLQVF